MSYADSLLSTGEVVHHRERQHWFILLWAGRYGVLAILAGIVLIVLSSNITGSGAVESFRSLLGFATAALIIGGLLDLAWEALKYRYQEYVITNRRVIQVGGVINKHSTDSSLEKINDAALSQSIFGRMFGFGDLDVLTASEAGIERFRMIMDPIAFKRSMLDAKHEYELEVARGPIPSSPPLRAGSEPRPPEREPAPQPDPVAPSPVAAPAAPPPPAAPPAAPRMSADEVTRTLASLADLRDRGAISPEDYDQKKADLLGRI